MKTIKFIAASVVLAIFALIWWIACPAISFGFFGNYLFLVVGIMIEVAILALPNNECDDYNHKLLIFAALVFLIIGIVFRLMSSAIFHSGFLANQGKFEMDSSKDFTKDIVEIDMSQIPTVDIELAKNLASKRMGEEVALASQVTVGEFTNKFEMNGKLYYVAPLEHRGFWQWIGNSTTPGYILVSATDSTDTKLVKEVDGKPLNLKYLSSAFFGSNLKRHVRQNCPFAGLTEWSFELDDTGYPYWVVTTYENKRFWSAPDVTGVVICDPQTGECKWYAVKDVPEWVDVVYPEWIVQKQLNNYGTYLNGWWNPGEKGEFRLTPNFVTMYNNDDCYYYTGITSARSNDTSITGFVLVNTRTKETMFYKYGGANERSAEASAEGLVSEKGYNATEPIALNVSGIPTYFMTLKDKSGLVKMYGFVNIHSNQIVSVKESIEVAKRAYINAVNSNHGTIDFGATEVYGYMLEAKVERFDRQDESGNTVYYFILEGDKDHIFTANYLISDELAITQAGDTVKITYADDSTGTITVTSFDNLAFGTRKTEAQEDIDETVRSGNQINNENYGVINVDPEKNEEFWNSLSDEEKAKIMENR